MMPMIISKSRNGSELAVPNNDYGQSFADLMVLFAKNNRDIEAARILLRPTFIADDVIQSPIVPTRAIAQSISPFVTLSFALSFGALLVFVFAREALRNTKDSPNMTRIRRAMRLWAKP